MTKPFHSTAYDILLTVLISARRGKGLTQQAVADRLQKPQSYIAKIEGGERRLDILEFIALAQAIGSDPEKLFKEVVARTR